MLDLICLKCCSKAELSISMFGLIGNSRRYLFAQESGIQTQLGIQCTDVQGFIRIGEIIEYIKEKTYSKDQIPTTTHRFMSAMISEFIAIKLNLLSTISKNEDYLTLYSKGIVQNIVSVIVLNYMFVDQPGGILQKAIELMSFLKVNPDHFIAELDTTIAHFFEFWRNIDEAYQSNPIESTFDPKILSDSNLFVFTEYTRTKTESTNSSNFITQLRRIIIQIFSLERNQSTINPDNN